MSANYVYPLVTSMTIWRCVLTEDLVRSQVKRRHTMTISAVLA
jgi:hypothetical protein